jgi:hypothetical protein
MTEVWLRDARGRFLAGSFYDLAGAADYVEFEQCRPRQFQVTEVEIIDDRVIADILDQRRSSRVGVR